MGQAVHDHAYANGYTVVREIGGHGIGLEFHEEPWVGYNSKAGTEMLMVPGMVFTIEPMVNMGQADIFVDEENDWTVYTADGQPSEQNTFEKIYEVVKQIPKGKVATYGQVAALAGNRRWARVVGYALHANPNEQEIPCYRVVTKDGRVSKAFAFGGENRQMELLVADGVEFEDGHVVMEKYQWDTPFADFGIR